MDILGGKRKMYSKPDLINAACDYAEKSERLRGKYRKMCQDYIQGKIDQYDESLIPNIPLVGRLFEPQEIRVMRSVLEEKAREGTLE